MTSSECLAQTRRKTPFLGVVRQLSQLRAWGCEPCRQPVAAPIGRAVTTPPAWYASPPPAPPKPSTTGKPPVALGTFKISGRISPAVNLIADLGREPPKHFTGSGE